jgi:hypothetical protein
MAEMGTLLPVDHLLFVIRQSPARNGPCGFVPKADISTQSVLLKLFKE